MFLVSATYMACIGLFPDTVAAETVEPSNDRSLESWTDCPVFAITFVWCDL